MATVPPTFRCCLSAVPASMTTWLAPVAQRPCSSRNGVSCSKPFWRLSRPIPKYGPSPIGSPERSSIRVWVFVRSPTATPACGTRRTASSVAAEIVGFFV
jgi:hypothetical protein